MIDGSSTVFYTTAKSTHDASIVSFNNIFGAYFLIDYEYTQYDQFINYQITGIRNNRNLQTNAKNDKEIMSTYYLIFYIMAQFGGLY